jgi:prephenate dehydrogenase
MAERVAVLGLGLIGGSLAGALRRAGSHVTGFDASAQAVRVAAARQLVDDCVDNLTQLLAGAQLVVLSVPVLTILDLLPGVDALTPPDAPILDTGSVKRQVVGVMDRLVNPGRAIGGHPLAGSDRSGPEAADPELFCDRPFVLTPCRQTQPAMLERAKDLVLRLGARPVIMEPEEHDRVLARTSHLPQLVSSALASRLGAGDLAAAGPGLKDMTRLAGSDPRMWKDILVLNRENVVGEARAFMAELAALVEAVNRGEMEQVESVMRRGGAASAGLREQVAV